MATIFDDAVNTTKNVASAINKKAGEIVDEVKINLKISDVQGEIEKRYKDIGRIIYENKKSGEDSALNVDEIVKELDVLFSKYADHKKTLAELKKKNICFKCDTANPEDNNYCAKCGERLR